MFEDGTETAFGYLDEPTSLVAALTEELGEDPTIRVYAGDPDCGASTSYSYSIGIHVRQLDPLADFQEPGDEGPLGFKVFADASTASAGAMASITTAAGGKLGTSAEPLFAALPPSWVGGSADVRHAVVLSSTLLGLADDDPQASWDDRWGLAVAEDNGVLTEIGSPVGLTYFC
ncbi:hypothetical protein ACFDTO_28235 [Microbacteriaceae bacterium 4G12]